MKKAVILLSGGLDSATCLAIAQNAGFTCHGLSFIYGQKHTSELRAAGRVAQQMQIEHRIFPLDIGQFGKSALTDHSVNILNYDSGNAIKHTYVPARNTIFLAIALGFAEIIEAKDIFIGLSATDYSQYPDCRPEFIEEFEKLANIGTSLSHKDQGFTIHAPLQHLNKTEIIRMGTKLGVDYGLTISCYQATTAGEACGNCDSCITRQSAFESVGVIDPTLYVL